LVTSARLLSKNESLNRKVLYNFMLWNQTFTITDSLKLRPTTYHVLSAIPEIQEGSRRYTQERSLSSHFA
jgi:hypothetical protein